MNKTIFHLMPEFLKRPVKIAKETKELQKLPDLKCNIDNVKFADEVNLQEIFNSQEIEKQWESDKAEIQKLEISESADGVNAGDRRAIFYLISHFKPSMVLEIGTHIGASTAHIAKALYKTRKDTNEQPVLVSVDIVDVNDTVTKPWIEYGTKYSPSEVINKLDCGNFVSFVTSPSTDYLSKCEQKFDFIFLDGSHVAKTVYQEIPAALKLLNENGVILLHDYYPNLKPLWSNGVVIPGPVLAVERFITKGFKFKVLPLGKLPWTTKINSNITSLALLLRDR